MFIRTESDAQLVARTRKGDVEAFNYLVSRWEKRLYNYLLRLVGNREDSLDLCQEAFLKAYQSLRTLQDAEKFPGWLYRIAHNLAYSHLRRPAPMESLDGNPGQDWTSNWPNDWEDARTSLRASASPRLAGAFGLELEFAVARALDSLAPEQREAILLKIYHGFLFDEIAEIISCPVSTVKSRIYAGFARLREQLAAVPAQQKQVARRR